jgi:hypothetical protein
MNATATTRFRRRGRDAAGDHIADLALSVAGDDVGDFGGAHSLAASPIEMKWPARVYQFRRGSKDSAKIAEYLADRVKADSLSLATQLKSAATVVGQLERYNGLDLPGFPRSRPLHLRSPRGKPCRGSRAEPAMNVVASDAGRKIHADALKLLIGGRKMKPKDCLFLG